jgi:hypothetical protein
VPKQFVEGAKSHCRSKDAPGAQCKENDVPVNTGEVLYGNHPETSKEANKTIIYAEIHCFFLNIQSVDITYKGLFLLILQRFYFTLR